MKCDYLIPIDAFILTPELREQLSLQFKYNGIYCSAGQQFPPASK